MFGVDVGGDQRLDHIGDHRRELSGGLAEFGIATRAATKKQLERVVVVMHPLEIRDEAELGALASLGGGDSRIGDRGEKARASLFDEGQIQLSLRGKVLVQHGLGDARGLGHVVHGCLVVPLTSEHIHRNGEQLLTSFGGRQPH